MVTLNRECTISNELSTCISQHKSLRNFFYCVIPTIAHMGDMFVNVTDFTSSVCQKNTFL